MCNDNAWNNVRVKLGAWNIQGIMSSVYGNKCQNNEFLENIVSSDIIGLTETHTSSDTEIQVPGFHVIAKHRPRHVKACNSSGGIAVCIRDSLVKGTEVVLNCSMELIWIKLKKEFFRVHKDIFVAFVYIPPCSSKYAKRQSEGMFDKLENDISKLPENADIIIMGDLNGRTKDLIDNNGNFKEPRDEIFDALKQDTNKPRRYNRDAKKKNTQGQNIINFCHSMNLHILNGRIIGDTLGNYTYYGKLGIAQ